MDPQNLGDLCLAASKAGPEALAATAIAEINGEQRWVIRPDAPASIDDPRGEQGGLLVTFATKLGALAAAQLASIGTLLTAPVPAQIGISSLGRSVMEACGSIAWLLDDSDDISSGIRQRRAWLLWVVAEGEAALTAEADAGRTGAMSGSPQRLARIEADLHDTLCLRIERSERSKPRDWRLDGVSLPGRRTLVVDALGRFFSPVDRAAGVVLYGQVSRDAHSDLVAAHGRVNGRLRISGGEGFDFVSTTLAFWASTWKHLLWYLGVKSTDFDAWRREMLIAVRTT